MFGLPTMTEVKRQLPKKAIYDRFGLSNAERDRIDADIAHIVISNEISPSTTTITQGQTVSAIFVLTVTMKRRDYDIKTLSLLSRLIDQKMIMALIYGNDCQLTVFHKSLIKSDWKPLEDNRLILEGFNLDQTWDSIIQQIGGFSVERGKTLDEQIAVNAERERIEKEIARLEKLARKEIQPKRKFELVQKINELNKKLE